MPNRTTFRGGKIALGAGLLCGLALLYFFDPAGNSLYPPCPFHALSGLYCPGCGSLRATHQLLHARPLAALALNPLMVLSLPFIGYALLSDFFSGERRAVSSPFVVWLIFGVVMAYWVLRNIPAEPFALLAPHV